MNLVDLRATLQQYYDPSSLPPSRRDIKRKGKNKNSNGMLFLDAARNLRGFGGRGLVGVVARYIARVLQHVRQ